MAVSFLEAIHGSYFENYQENGTKYIRNSCQLQVGIKEELDQCAGEIFLNGISEGVNAEQIVSIASTVGEVYMLRFKINFSGQSRGFAYIQYINPGLMNLAIERLPEIFLVNGLGHISAQKSKNSSKLLLKYVFDMTPQMVEQTLRVYIHFRQLNTRLVRGSTYEFQIVLGSNDEAVRARRCILSNIHAFGRRANITWDVKKERHK